MLLVMQSMKAVDDRGLGQYARKPSMPSGLATVGMQQAHLRLLHDLQQRPEARRTGRFQGEVPHCYTKILKPANIGTIVRAGDYKYKFMAQA